MICRVRDSMDLCDFDYAVVRELLFVHTMLE